MVYGAAQTLFLSGPVPDSSFRNYRNTKTSEVLLVKKLIETVVLETVPDIPVRLLSKAPSPAVQPITSPRLPVATPQQVLTLPAAPAPGRPRPLNNTSPVETLVRPNAINTHHIPDAFNQPPALGLQKPAMVLRGGPNLPQRPHSYISTQLAQQNVEIQRQQLAQTTSHTKPRLPLPPNLRMEPAGTQMVVLPGHPMPLQIQKDASRCGHKNFFLFKTKCILAKRSMPHLKTEFCEND